MSVILFNSSTILPGDNNTDECYNTTMAFAGTFTINYLKSFIDRAQPKGKNNTSYFISFSTLIIIFQEHSTTTRKPAQNAWNVHVILLFCNCRGHSYDSHSLATSLTFLIVLHLYASYDYQVLLATSKPSRKPLRS